MKASKTLWLKRLVIGSAVAALPQLLLARGPDFAEAPPCPPDALPAEGMRSAPPQRPQQLPADGLSAHPAPPWLHGVELSAAQRDALFELRHAQAPSRRALEKQAAQAFDELQRLSHGDRFNAKQARTLADAYAQALAGIAYQQAENDSQLRALLTAPQRQQLDAAPGARRERDPGAAEHQP